MKALVGLVWQRSKKGVALVGEAFELVANFTIASPRNILYVVLILLGVVGTGIAITTVVYVAYNVGYWDNFTRNVVVTPANDGKHVLISQEDNGNMVRVNFSLCSTLKAGTKANYQQGGCEEGYAKSIDIDFILRSNHQGESGIEVISNGPARYPQELKLVSIRSASGTNRSAFNVKTPVSIEVIERLFDEQMKLLDRSNTADDFVTYEPTEGEAAERFKRLLAELELKKRREGVQDNKKINGSIQYWTFVMFFCFLIIMFSKYRMEVITERKLLEDSEALLSSLENRSLSSGEVLEELNTLELALKERRRVFEFMGQQFDRESFTHRLLKNAITGIQNGENTLELAEHLATDSEIIERWKESSFELPNYFVWSIPTLGFIGTVVGISQAMGFSEGVGSENELTRSLARGLVSSEIGIAFNTTLVALILVLIAQFILNFVRRAEMETLMASTDTSIELGKMGIRKR